MISIYLIGIYWDRENALNYVSVQTLGGARKGSKFEFKYDRVFTPENTQADVFDEISQLVQVLRQRICIGY